MYAAQDLVSGRQVALKVVQLAGVSASRRQQLERVVQREVRLSSSITAHDHVLQLLDVFAEGDSELIIVVRWA